MSASRVFGKDHIEAGAMEQFESAMEQDFVVQGALMPDAHYGYSLPIGGVVATKDVIVPSWVGYDIGCGMCAIQTPFNAGQLTEGRRETIFNSIYRSVPTGMGQRFQKPQDIYIDLPLSDVARGLLQSKGVYQLGTLGSGNHFIEIDRDVDGHVWIVLHSGSRGFGWNIAKHYMTEASGGQKAKEGHYPLAVTSELGQAYIMDMNFALEYALDNRKRMIEAVLKDINHAVHGVAEQPAGVDWTHLINRNHNHAVERDLNGETVWIHRKGATHAEVGMMGVIPGNMADGSFIVRGKGEPSSLFSSSHGAGRMGSRRFARENLSLDTFKRQMEGITALVNENTLDEAPGAYKNPFDVIEEQSELIDVVHHLTPIINIKANK